MMNMVLKLFVTALTLIFIVILFFLGSAFIKDIEDKITGESYPDEEGQIIGYTFYAAGIATIIILYCYLC